MQKIILVLAYAALAACTGDPNRSASPPRAVQAAVTETVYTFPTSQRTPKDKAWKHMSEGGNTESLRNSCSLIRLSRDKCDRFERMHTAGQCLTMEVQNGTVLDWLTFTDAKGRHLAQPDVLVALENPSTRKAEVCDLGDGVYGIRFHGCNNYAVVINKRVRIVTSTERMCSASWYVKPKSWTASALGVEGVRQIIAETKRGYEVKDRLSRKKGNAIDYCGKLGKCSLSTYSYTVTASYIKDEGGEIKASKPIGSFALKNGEAKILVPELASGSWNAVRVVYHDKDFRLESPHVGRTGEEEIRVYDWEFKEEPCKPGRLIHSIEKENPS